jgi:hypothetical protein
VTHHDEDAQNALAEAITALNKACGADTGMTSADPTRLATVVARVTGIAANLTKVIDSLTTSARRMSEQADDAAVAEAHHDTRLAGRAAARTARALHRNLLAVHALAWDARDIAVRTSTHKPSGTGVDIRDLLQTAETRLAGAAQHTTADPIVLAWIASALTGVNDRLIDLTGTCTKAAGRLKEQSTVPAAQAAHHDTERATVQAARSAHSLRRNLATAQTCAEQARAAAVRKCPECGEAAIPQTPHDLTPGQRRATRKPAWSHRDGTQLCPVVGRDGYEPAQPA